MGEQSIRVALVDDQQLLRDGLAILLSLEPDIAIVGQAENGREAVARAREWDANVILLDLRMPVQDGLRALPELRQRCPETLVVVLTTYDEDKDVIEALRQGAVGYLLKDMPVDQIAAALRSVVAGGVILPPAIAGKVVAELRQATVELQARGDAVSPVAGQVEGGGLRKVSDPLQVLTEREREVLALVAEGLSNQEIGSRLFIAEGTVKTHMSNIIAKLGLRDRTQAAIYALKADMDA